MESLSSGEKQIISIFSKLYLEIKKSCVILIDEPELSISMEWQRTLLPDILNSPKCLFLMAATHSPFIFDNALDIYAVALDEYVKEHQVMSSVQSMRNDSQNNSVKFMEFTRICSKKPECLICFFEGEDDKYYGFRIKEILGIESKGIDCGGKQQVISLFRMLANHSHEPYRKAKTAFFVDRDFDDPQPPEIRADI